jgi:rRNA maturation RNase YbeY
MKTILGSSPRVTGRTEFDKAADAVERLASRFPPAAATVEISLIGERRMAELNRRYKGRRGAAEILTFAYGDPDSGAGRGDDPCGEVFLCWKKLVSGAARRRVSNRDYLLRLVAHGLCHIKGYGHSDDQSYRMMEKAEKKYLAGMVSETAMARLFG